MASGWRLIRFVSVFLVSIRQCIPMFENNDVPSLFHSTNRDMPQFPLSSENRIRATSHDIIYNQLVDQSQYHGTKSSNLLSLPTISHANHFSSWANWGGHWFSDPQCLSLKDEGLDAFTVGLDGCIYYRGGHHQTLQPWVKIDGARATFPPAVAVQRDGSIDVIIHGVDNTIYYSRRSPEGKWQAFESLNFKSYRRPAVAPWFNRGLFIFAIGTDHQIYKLERRHERWWFGNTANDWVSLGGSWSGGLTGAFISGPDLTADVYALAYDNHGNLQYTRFHITNADSKLGNWVGKWTSLDIQGTLAPAVSARANGFDVVVRTKDAKMAVNSYNLDGDSWVGWVSLDLLTVTIPAIASHAWGFIYLFAVDMHHQLQVCMRTSQKDDFGPWYSMGGPYTSSPSALVRENLYVDVFILDATRQLIHSSMPFM